MKTQISIVIGSDLLHKGLRLEGSVVCTDIKFGKRLSYPFVVPLIFIMLCKELPFS